MFHRTKLPEETGPGTVEIRNNRLISQGSTGDIWYRQIDWDVDIDIFILACALVDEKGHAYLYLNGDDRDIFIPVYNRGFGEVYKELSTRFGFNDRLFSRVVSSPRKRKEVIWRQPIGVEYEITENFAAGDHTKGFEIQSPVKEFISWDTTYDKMVKHPQVEIIANPSTRYLQFCYPIRIGRLILKSPKAYIYDRTDTAVRVFLENYYNPEANDGSYTDFFNALLADFGEESIFYSRTHEDEKEAVFESEGISISISYQYDGQYYIEKGYTTLRIANEREYPELLIDLPYEQEMEISDYLVIESAVSLSCDYKRDVRVKRRQPLITERFGNSPVIWRDDRNGKIGLADPTFSLVYDKAEITSFILGNLIPAKGSGGSDLTANLSGEPNWNRLFLGEYHSMNEYAERIAILTDKEVVLDTEYSDC